MVVVVVEGVVVVVEGVVVVESVAKSVVDGEAVLEELGVVVKAGVIVELGFAGAVGPVPAVVAVFKCCTISVLLRLLVLIHTYVTYFLYTKQLRTSGSFLWPDRTPFHPDKSVNVQQNGWVVCLLETLVIMRTCG